jgi:hypothetical protein
MRRLAAATAIIGLLFAQLAVAAHACPMPSQAEYDTSSAQVAMPCDAMDDMDGVPSGLCEKHCQAGHENVGDTNSTVAATPFCAAFVTTLDLAAPAVLESALIPAHLLHTSSPPLSIRNCCFRI